MVTQKTRMTTGYALLGLALGILIFTIFYVATYRTGIAQRFVYSWVAIHLLVLFGPAALLALYGANRKPEPLA